MGLYISTTNKMLVIAKKLNRFNMVLAILVLLLEAIVCISAYQTKDFITFKNIVLAGQITAIIAIINLIIEYTIIRLNKMLLTK